MFYAYLWLREDGTPYYVGKGKEYRGFVNKSHRVFRPKDKNLIIIQHHENEKDAFEAEKFLIDYYGRKDTGTGCLRNMTCGGEGASGVIVGIKTREKLSVLSKGRKYPEEFGQQVSERMLGNKNGLGKRSEQARQNISQGKMGVKASTAHRQSMSKARKGVPWTAARWAAQAARVGK
jgi:hypothetical protein